MICEEYWKIFDQQQHAWLSQFKLINWEYEMTQENDVAELVKKLLGEGEGCNCYANNAGECDCTNAIWGDNYRKEAAETITRLAAENEALRQQLAEGSKPAPINGDKT